MKSHRFMLFVVLMSLSTVAFAQSEAHKPVAPKSEAQKSFDTLKTLAGEWEGKLTVDPPQPDMNNGKPVRSHVTMRVTSRGNALVHEMQEAGTLLDWTKYDHPVTMLYLDTDQLTLIHYCDAGNRPRMIGKTAPDGKKVDFEYRDLSVAKNLRHMQHALLASISMYNQLH